MPIIISPHVTLLFISAGTRCSHCWSLIRELVLVPVSVFSYSLCFRSVVRAVLFEQLPPPDFPRFFSQQVKQEKQETFPKFGNLTEGRIFWGKKKERYSNDRETQKNARKKLWNFKTKSPSTRTFRLTAVFYKNGPYNTPLRNVRTWRGLNSPGIDKDNLKSTLTPTPEQHTWIQSTGFNLVREGS